MILTLFTFPVSSVLLEWPLMGSEPRPGPLIRSLNEERGTERPGRPHSRCCLPVCLPRRTQPRSRHGSPGRAEYVKVGRT